MKKRLRHVQVCEPRVKRFAVKLFADEEAIETLLGGLVCRNRSIL